jgi:hypothetical protein
MTLPSGPRLALLLLLSVLFALLRPKPNAPFLERWAASSLYAVCVVLVVALG